MVTAIDISLSLARTAERIAAGVPYVIAIKEHVDTWNKVHDAKLFTNEPLFLDATLHWVDAWCAGAAEYEAFILGVKAPEWVMHSDRFLKQPFLMGGNNARRYALIETPFSWRKRMVFSGKTSLR